MWESSYLWYNGDPGSQLMQAQLSDVDPVNVDLSLGGFDDAEETQGQRGLAGSCPPDYANLGGHPLTIPL